MRQRRRSRLSHDGEDDDPMSVVSNLFDVAMVFALALMVALVSRYNMTEMFSKDNFTMVKNPGKENMEIITKDGQKINRYTPSEDQSKKSGNKGKKVGIAYQLENGEIIYQDAKGQDIAKVRKAKAIDDISGDYKQYANIEKLAVGKDIVIVEGDNRSFCTAIWHKKGYSYSITLQEGVSRRDIVAMVVNIL